MSQKPKKGGQVPPMESGAVSQGEPTKPYLTEDKKVDKLEQASVTTMSGFVPGGGSGKGSCGSCQHYCAEYGCNEVKVLLDPDVPDGATDGYKNVDAADWCAQYAAIGGLGNLKTVQTAGATRFRKFVKLDSVDEAKREVGGVVTAETVDKVGEVCHYKTTKPFYEAWSEELSKNSGGKNLGNLREMHGLSAAGAGKSIDFDDANKFIRMTFKVVDDNAWRKVQEGVYTGFSHGGDYIRKWDANGTKMYTARPSEVSLVDSPCLPDATFDFVRADGTHELRKFSPPPVTMPTTPDELAAVVEQEIAKREVSSKERDKLADEGKAMPDGSYPIANAKDLSNAVQAYGRAKNKAKVKAHIKQRAKALGREDLLPDTWKATADSLKKNLLPANREKIDQQVEAVI